MDRLRDFAARNRNKRPFQFSLPSSLSRRHLAQDYTSLTSQTCLSNESQSNMNPGAGAGANAGVASRIDASTQTDFTCPDPPTPQPSPDHHKSTNTKTTAKKGKSNKGKQAIEHEAIRKRQETERELFALAENMAAQNDKLSENGRQMSTRLNEMAREVFEANQVIEEKSHKISALEKQLSGMQLKFDKAHFELQQAQDLAARVLDQAMFDHYIKDTRVVFEGQIHGMKNWVTQQDVKAWSPERIEMFLHCLQAVHRAHEGDFNHTEAATEDIASMIHLFKDVECDAKYADLLALADGSNSTDNNPDMGHHEDHKVTYKKQEATYQWALASPFSEVESSKKKEEEGDAGPSNKLKFGAPLDKNFNGTCGCFACHVGKWAANKYGDEAPETLRTAFLQTIRGMETGVEGFVSATMALDPEFRKTALEALRIVYQSIGREELASSDNSVIREAIIRLGSGLGSGFHLMAPGSYPEEDICACCRGEQDLDEISSTEN